VISATIDDPERISLIANDLRAGLRTLSARSEREKEAEARIRDLRRVRRAHPRAYLYIRDPGGGSAGLRPLGLGASPPRERLTFPSRDVPRKGAALLELQSGLDDYLLVVSTAMAAEARSDALRFVRDGLAEHGERGPGGQLLQWAGLLTHLRGEPATPIFLDLARSSIAPVRHAALSSGCLTALAEESESALDWILDAMGDEDPSRQIPALVRVVESQCGRRGRTTVHEWLQRLQRRAESRPNSPDWALSAPDTLLDH